jgi:FtsP/CotA-like multicopper oxidase with cupredoxin domain
MKKLLPILFLITANSLFAQKAYYRLIMRNTGTDTMWDGKSMKVYGYTKKLSENPLVPGHILYANEGDTLTIDGWNISQGDPHTIHPHGMDADQQNDGTPMTSFTIKHMQTYQYRIPCTHAGTYIYHCHMSDVVHVQMGMYGLVIVRPKDGSKTAWTGGPAFSKEYAFLTSEFDIAWHDSVPQNPNHLDTLSMDSMMHEDFNIPNYLPDYFLVNGKSKSQIIKDSSLYIKGKANEFIYIRLANIGYYMNRIIFPAALDATWIDSDGRPLPKSIKNDTILVAPGERYGVMLKAKKEFTDSVAIQYYSMNTRIVEDVEYLPLSIKGFAGIEPHINSFPIVNIYPNPAESYINIRFGDNVHGPIQIELVNATGQVVKFETINTPPPIVRFNFTKLPSGIYSLRIFDSKRQFVGKIIVD